MAQIAEVIKYEGDNSTFIWKHPSEDFNSMTQLIVHESQEAIFFMNGQALDLFGPGRHTLETQNIPLLGKIFNKITGNNNAFHCEVYFINKKIYTECQRRCIMDQIKIGRFIAERRKKAGLTSLLFFCFLSNY